MKHILPILLCLLLLCAGCAERKTFSVESPTAAPKPEEPTRRPNPETPPVIGETPEPVAPEETATPEPTPIPKPTIEPILYDSWEKGTCHGPDITAFVYDLDQDGEEEEINVHLDADAHTCTVTDGARSIFLEDGCVLDGMILCDLDPGTPHLNLVVVLGSDSSDYITIELHPEGDALVRGASYRVPATVKHGEVVLFEEALLLGWSYGVRPVFGEDMIPTTEWVTIKYIPTEEELRKQKDALIKASILLHVMRPVPCTIDGESAVLPMNTYVYRTRYLVSRDLMEVVTLDGTVALIAFTLEGETYLIDGVPQTEYFDNLGW